MPSPSQISVDLPIEVLGGMVTQFDPQKLPMGASPFCQDVSFVTAGGVQTRPGMQSVYQNPFASNPTVNYLRTFVDLAENIRQLNLDGLGNVRQEYPPGILSIIGNVVPGAFAQSDTYAGKEWEAFSDGAYGLDIPRHWDGVNFDRVSQVGPGASPTAVDGAAGNISAGLHQVACCFITRNGYVTAPSIPNSWTAAGTKKVNLTNIPTGPQNVVARICIFTPVITPPAGTGPFFYFATTTPSGALTFPSMIINDNVATTATFDFLDAVLENATAATLLFNLLELGECSAVRVYSERTFWTGERNKVNTAGGGGGFNNLTFDGGFGGGAPTPANSGATSPSAAANNSAFGGTYATGDIVISGTSSNSQSVSVGALFTANFNYPSGAPSYEWAGLAQAVAAALNGSGYVSATTSGAEVLITSLTQGAGGNYAISVTGFNASVSGLTGGANGSAWTNPGNVFALDGVFATDVLPAKAASQYLYASGFGLAIPSNATVVGIVMKAYVEGSTAIDLSDASVLLGNSSGPLGTDHKNGNLWTAAIAAQTYGSNVDNWSLPGLSPAFLNDPTFGVYYAAQNHNAGAARTASIDYFSITVYYTTPGGAGQYPLGWTQGANFAGGDSAVNKGIPSYAEFGDAFAITGDGVTTIRGQISEAAAVDYLGIPIIAQNVAYSVRARIGAVNGLVQGTLHVNLQSTTGAFTTGGLAVQANQLSGSYVEFIAQLTSGLTTIPADLVIQVYADGTPTNGGTFLIDCVEVFPTLQPINRTIIRCSYAEDPESFDVETGLIIVGKDNGQAIRTLFWLLDNKLYIVKERSMYGTNDDGQNEPDLWTVSTISETVGTASVNGAAVGETWAVIGSHDGAYIFDGTTPKKISQEVQPTWATINWNAGTALYTVVDTQNRRIHIGAPVGASTVPNVEFVLDYNHLGTAEDIVDHPQAYYSAYQPTKIIAPGRARKWALWNLFAGGGANCAAFTIRQDGSYHLLRGNATGMGKVYDQSDVQLSDDGVAINSQYQTYFFPETEQEEALQLGSHRKLIKYLTGYVWGSGFMFFTLTGPQGQRQKSLSTLALAAIAQWDFEMNVNWVGERASLIFGTNAVNSRFTLTKLCPVLQREIMTPIRGVA